MINNEALQYACSEASALLVGSYSASINTAPVIPLDMPASEMLQANLRGCCSGRTVWTGPLSQLCEHLADAIVADSIRMPRVFKCEVAGHLSRLLANDQADWSSRLAAVRALAVLVKQFSSETILHLRTLLAQIDNQPELTQRIQAYSLVCMNLLTAMEHGSDSVLRRQALDLYAATDWYHTDTTAVERTFENVAAASDDLNRLEEMIDQLLVGRNYMEAEILLQRAVTLAAKDSARPLELPRVLYRLAQVRYQSGGDDESISRPSYACELQLVQLLPSTSDRLAHQLLNLALINERNETVSAYFAGRAVAIYKDNHGLDGQFTRSVLDRLDQAGISYEINAAARDIETVTAADVETSVVRQDLLVDLRLFEQRLADAGVKASTRRVYVSRVRQILAFVRDEYPVQDKPRDLKDLLLAFLANARSKGLMKPGTINNFISTFRLFSMTSGYRLDDIPAEKLTRIASLNARTYLSPADQDELIKQARSGKSARNTALVLLFLRSRIKIGECARLLVSDLVWGDATLKIRISSDTREQYEPVSAELASALQTWLLERDRLPSAVDSPYLFPGLYGNKITTSAIDAALRKLGWQVNLNVCSRVLRNTFMRQASATRSGRARVSLCLTGMQRAN